MKITIEIPDKEIKEEIKSYMVREFTAGALASRRLIKECQEVVKQMIYEPELKAKIIDNAVKKAAHEIRRKGMPILANELMENEENE